MMQSEVLVQTTWPFHSCFDTDLDHYESDHHESLSSISNSPESSLITSESYGNVEYPVLGYDQMQHLSPADNDSQNIMDLDDVCRWLCEEDQDKEEIQSNDVSDCVLPEEQSPMEEPYDVMEPEMGLQNLLKAYAEAMAVGQTELAQVIIRCTSERINPIGSAFERIAFNMFQCAENQEEYLQQESTRNFKSAFRAFYEIFPYGRFAHFTANSAILEAIPTHVESIHIVDFDLGKGSQWPTFIEAVARMKKSLIITNIKLDQDKSSQFEQTKRLLGSFARNCGLNLEVQEMEFAQIESEMKGREFVAFNCIVDLPHMGKTSKRSQVMDFLKVAKGLLVKNKGIVTFADGDECGRVINSSDFSSYFNKNLIHYKALYESMEWGFPSNLTEAMMTLETLFVAPFISSKSWLQQWDKERQNMVFHMGLGLKGRPMSRESFNEARQLVKDAESPYGIKIEGDNGNEMVLSWNGTSLVRVCSWM
uniref:protein NODULATION SIGNALING PATHWAY 2-like n=1 Tax=Erigeron canadensis TaxID=72917 RepID=UPI001CB93DF4|nr:protein NODULATION SIGNALING PATHWAY 2-like [Erigeron canadensis]